MANSCQENGDVRGDSDSLVKSTGRIYLLSKCNSLKAGKRYLVSPTKAVAMISFGAMCGMIIQVYLNFNEVTSLALKTIPSPSAPSRVSLKGPGKHKPPSRKLGRIDKMWRAVNQEPSLRAFTTSSTARKFGSKRWYSRRNVSNLSPVRSTWVHLLSGFMKDLPIAEFSERAIEEHFRSNMNNVQGNCMLVRVRNGKALFEKKFSTGQHGRYSSAVYCIEEILANKNLKIPDISFLVMLNDGNMPRIPTFGSARHWDSWKNMIPVPLGNIRGESEGWGTPVEGWDLYIADTLKAKRVDFPWESKANKCVFRGALQMQTYRLGSCNVENMGRCRRATRWDQVNRGVMFKRAQVRPDLFDVAFTKIRSKPGASPLQFSGAPQTGESIQFSDMQKYKYVLNVGSNQDWAERLRSLMFMNSAVVLHAAETKEFFTPLIVPWKHVIPTDIMFSDLVENIKWALHHDKEVRRMVENMNILADNYLSESAMKEYWTVALLEYAERQRMAGKVKKEEIRSSDIKA